MITERCSEDRYMDTILGHEVWYSNFGTPTIPSWSYIIVNPDNDDMWESKEHHPALEDAVIAASNDVHTLVFVGSLD